MARRRGMDDAAGMVSSRELLDLITREVRARDWSLRDLDAECVARYEGTAHPMRPGVARNQVRRLAGEATCTVAVADRLLVALGRSLDDLASYQAPPDPLGVMDDEFGDVPPLGWFPEWDRATGRAA